MAHPTDMNRSKSLIETFDRGQTNIAPGTARNLRSLFEKPTQSSSNSDPLALPSPIKRHSYHGNEVRRATPDVAAGNGKEEEGQQFYKKCVLIVFAADVHETVERDLVDTARRHFEETGCSVILSDLHSQKFNPVGSSIDFPGCGSAGEAYEKGVLAKDIVEEQQKLNSADLVLVIFAQVLHGMPALIKGWLDRVLCKKFAYDVETNTIFDNGKMKGKKILMCRTVGGPSSLYTAYGILGDFKVYLFPEEWAMLRYCGFDVLQTQAYFNATTQDEARHRSHVTDWLGRLEGIWSEKPKQFLSLSQFEAEKGYSLCQAARLDLGTRSTAISVGHHLGKPIPAFVPPPDGTK